MDENTLMSKIQQLYAIKREIAESGEIAPENCWIHQYEISRQWSPTFSATYTYAKWQASKPIFKRNPKKRAGSPKPGKNVEFSTHKHIGRVSSTTGLGPVPEVEEAYAALARRDRLHQIESALEKIEEILKEVLPSESYAATKN